MLRVNDLSVSIGAKDDFVDIVSSVSLAIDKGEILGLVGESGCGKSMTSLAVMGLMAEDGPWVRTGAVSNSRVSTSRISPRTSASRRGTAASR